MPNMVFYIEILFYLAYACVGKSRRFYLLLTAPNELKSV